MLPNVPATLGPFEDATPVQDSANSILLPLQRRQGFYPAILGAAYARKLARNVTSHNVTIALVGLNAQGSAPIATAPRVVLLDDSVGYFTVLSDGERSIVPPFVAAGAEPYAWELSWDAIAGNFPGQFRYWWRWVPRDTRTPPVTCGP